MKVENKTEKKLVKNYEYSDLFGTVVTDVTVTYLDGRSGLDDNEIERLTLLTLSKFEKENRLKIKTGKRSLSKEELYQLIIFFQIQALDMALLLSVDKSTVSKQLKGTSSITPAQNVLVFELLEQELNDRGYAQRRVNSIKSARIDGLDLELLDVDPMDLSLLLIEKFIQAGASITKLQLQKLLYFCEGLGIALFNVKLMRGNFFAWKHGPVRQEIYNWTKRWDKKQDLTKVVDLDQEVIVSDKRVKEIVDATFQKYGKLAAWALVDESHKPGSPWDQTPQSKKIPDKLMIKEFQGMFF